MYASRCSVFKEQAFRLTTGNYLIMSDPLFATGNFYREASSLLVVVALAATSNNISQGKI